MKPDFHKPLIVVCVLVTVGLGLMNWKATRLEAQITALKSKHAEELASTQVAGALRTLQANTWANSLAIKLSQSEAELSAVRQRKEHAILRISENRTCFNADLVRVLNDSSPGSEVTRLPSSTSGTDAGNEAVATDTDVALWIEGAKEQYDICRGRLKALIDFHNMPKATALKHD